MEKKELMTEESYQRSKKKIIKLSLTILIVGLVVGALLIAAGILLTSNSKKQAEKITKERYDAAYKESEKLVADAKDRLNEIDNQINELKAREEAKESECDSIPMGSANWFADVSKCRRESSEISSQISDLEDEKFKLENGNYRVNYTPAVAKNYTYLSIIGGILIFISGIVSLIIYIRAKRRDIMAFAGQEVMPLAQEGIEKMTPTAANAAGTMGKEVAKGITEGIKEGLNNNQDSTKE